MASRFNDIVSTTNATLLLPTYQPQQQQVTDSSNVEDSTRTNCEISNSTPRSNAYALDPPVYVTIIRTSPSSSSPMINSAPAASPSSSSSSSSTPFQSPYSQRPSSSPLISTSAAAAPSMSSTSSGNYNSNRKQYPTQHQMTTTKTFSRHHRKKEPPLPEGMMKIMPKPTKGIGAGTPIGLEVRN